MVVGGVRGGVVRGLRREDGRGTDREREYFAATVFRGTNRRGPGCGERDGAPRGESGEYGFGHGAAGGVVRQFDLFRGGASAVRVGECLSSAEGDAERSFGAPGGGGERRGGPARVDVATQMADSVFAVLSAYFPSDSVFFRRNYEGLVQEMDSIDRAARQIAERKRHGVFLIYHPALTYFARDYGMRQIAIEEEGKEPNPVHMKGIIDTCRAEGVRVVFIQSQFDQANAMTIAREIGGEVVQIDPLAEDWKAEMLRLLDVVDRKMD